MVVFRKTLSQATEERHLSRTAPAVGSGSGWFFGRVKLALKPIGRSLKERRFPVWLRYVLRQCPAWSEIDSIVL